MNLETDLRIEQILISLNDQNVNEVSQYLLYQLEEIVDSVNRQYIDKYLFLYKQLNSTPSVQLLEKEFPALRFDNLKPLSSEELLEYTRLFISRLRDKYTSNKLIHLAETIRQKGITEEISDYLNNFSKTEVIKSTYEDAFNRYKDLFNETKANKGIRLLVDYIDSRTGGIQPGQLVTLLGFAGSLKTTYAANISFNAIKDGFNVLYLSLEVPKNDMVANFLGRQSFEGGFKQIPVDDIRKKKLDEPTQKYLLETILPAFEANKGKLYLFDETDLDNYSFYSLEEKFREIDKLATEQTGHGLDLVVIDHAQLLKFSNNMSSVGSENSVINMYVSFFRQQCINFIHSKRQCSFLILSQANRDGWAYAAKHGGMYRLTALADANELERASSLIISVYTDEGMKMSQQAKVALIKSRNSETSYEAGAVFADPVFYAFGDIMDKATTSYQGSMNDLLMSSSIDNSNDQPILNYESLVSGSLEEELGII